MGRKRLKLQLAFLWSLVVGIWSFRFRSGLVAVSPRQPAEAKLISRVNRLAVLEINFQQLLTLDIDFILVLQSGDRPFRGSVNDISR